MTLLSGNIQIFIRSDAGNNEDCMLLITCLSGPIQGNLFWHAIVNGSEMRIARNDGGNAEPNPPYNEILLSGVTDYYTGVTRGIMNDNLFTTFNSTLSFNSTELVNFNVSNIRCGSVIDNSTTEINPLAGIRG